MTAYTWGACWFVTTMEESQLIVLTLFLDPIYVNFGLLGWRCNLFSFSHSVRSPRLTVWFYEFIDSNLFSFSYSVRSLTAKNIWVPSAYKQGIVLSRYSVNSFMNSRNNKGHRIDSCGAPQVIFLGKGVMPFTVQTCSLFVP